jgi:hypothetical protein
MGNPFKAPKPPTSPPPPKPDPELEAQKKAELERAEKERVKEIQDRLRKETQLNQSGGGGRRSLLSRGSQGFSLRSLLGGG